MDLNGIVSYTLIVGVITGALFGLVGLFLWSIQGFGTVDPVSGTRLFKVLSSAMQGNVVGVVYLGVFVLISTPVLRVALSVGFFATQKDREYVVITLFVLALLIIGLAFPSGA